GRVAQGRGFLPTARAARRGLERGWLRLEAAAPAVEKPHDHEDEEEHPDVEQRAPGRGEIGADRDAVEEGQDECRVIREVDHVPDLLAPRSVQDHGEPGGRHGHEHEKEGEWSKVELERDVPSEAREACLRVCEGYGKETRVEQYGEQCQQPLIRVEAIKTCAIESFPEFHVGPGENLEGNE